jgi:hypothetical protein
MKPRLPVKSKDSGVIQIADNAPAQLSANDKKGGPTPVEIVQPVKVPSLIKKQPTAAQ